MPITLTKNRINIFQGRLDIVGQCYPIYGTLRQISPQGEPPSFGLLSGNAVPFVSILYFFSCESRQHREATWP